GGSAGRKGAAPAAAPGRCPASPGAARPAAPAPRPGPSSLVSRRTPWPRGGGLRLGQLYLHLVALDAHGVAADLDPRVVRPGPVAQPEPPGVPRAGDDTVLDVAPGQRGPHVRANVVDGVDLVAHQEQGD